MSSKSVQVICRCEFCDNGHIILCFQSFEIYENITDVRRDFVKLLSFLYTCTNSL